MELDVRADGEHRYVVSGPEPAREHTISVPESLLDELRLTDADEPVLVRQALELLLAKGDHDLPRDFALTDVEALRPGFTKELQALVGRG